MRLRELKNRGVTHIICGSLIEQIIDCTPHSQNTWKREAKQRRLAKYGRCSNFFWLTCLSVRA